MKKDPLKWQELRQETYNGNLLFVTSSGDYLDYGFSHGAAGPPPIWRMQPVQNLTAGGHAGLHGYWIFFPNVNQCWQALNANGPLRIWNENGKANPPLPQDWELFQFDFVDDKAQQVRIKNVYGRYLRANGAVYVCDYNFGDPGVPVELFTVEF